MRKGRAPDPGRRMTDCVQPDGSSGDRPISAHRSAGFVGYLSGKGHHHPDEPVPDEGFDLLSRQGRLHPIEANPVVTSSNGPISNATLPMIWDAPTGRPYAQCSRSLK